MPIGRFLRHGHIFHPVRVLVCHSCAIICNSLVFWLLRNSPLSYNVKKLYIPVNLLYSGDGAEFIVEGHIYGFSPVTITNSCHAPGCGRRIPPVLPTAWVPFSGANAGSILRLRPGLSFECDSRAGVSKSGHFTHDMAFFHHDVRRKRFNTHGDLHCMEMIISKDHVAEKPRRG